MIRSLRKIPCTLMLLIALLVPPALAQPPITLTGTVTDASVEVLAGATVEAFHGDGVVTTTTEPDGTYRLDVPAAGGCPGRTR